MLLLIEGGSLLSQVTVSWGMKLRLWENSKLGTQIEKLICGALRDSVPFVKFKKRKKHPWRIVSFSKVAG